MGLFDFLRARRFRREEMEPGIGDPILKPDPKQPTLFLDGPVHGWFELSYAQYLTVPRSVLQAMPLEWQERFVECLSELDEAFAWRPPEGRYWVSLRDRGGRWHRDPLCDYRRPRFDHLESLRKRPGPTEMSE